MKLTLLLIVANVIVFLLTFQNTEYYIQIYGFGSDSFTKGDYATIITAMFMHKDILHIALNMSLLLSIGKQIEDEVGGLLMLVVYFAGGIFANLGVLLLPLIGQNATVIGASAAISGLIGYGAFKLSGDWVVAPLKFIPLPMPFIASGAMYFTLNFPGVLIFNLPSLGHLVGGFVGAFIGLSGEEEKLKKIIIFSVLIGFISLLTYLISVNVPWILNLL